MNHHPTLRLACRLCIAVSGLALLGACAQGLDYDLRGIGGGFSTSDGALNNLASARPQPDSRGVISYPNYQVAVADRGDTIGSVAARLGVDAPTLARFNGIEENAPLREGEIVALPGRVSPVTGAPGTTAPGGAVDISALAGDAITRSEMRTTGQSSGDVRVAALPPSAPAPSQSESAEPVRHKVQRGETAYTISRLYDVPVQSLAEWNGLGANYSIREGQYLLIPVAQRPAPVADSGADVAMPGRGSTTPTPPSATKPLPETEDTAVADTPPPAVDVGAQTISTDTGRMLFPVTGMIIREYVKDRNDGINIKGPAGMAVKAADSGTVAAITKSADGIPIIVIRHDPELLTVYANVIEVSVEKGASVARGESIAKLRDGEEAFVHFEVRRGFDSVDPMPYLR